MTRYRAVRVDGHRGTFYEVEKEGWFGWSTERYWYYDSTCTRSFKTVDEAVDYIRSKEKPVRTVVGVREIEAI